MLMKEVGREGRLRYVQEGGKEGRREGRKGTKVERGS